MGSEGGARHLEHDRNIIVADIARSDNEAYNIVQPVVLCQPDVKLFGYNGLTGPLRFVAHACFVAVDRAAQTVPGNLLKDLSVQPFEQAQRPPAVLWLDADGMWRAGISPTNTNDE
jgi:hypothetical protein